MNRRKSPAVATAPEPRRALTVLCAAALLTPAVATAQADALAPINAQNIQAALGAAGWQVFGTPDRPNADSITRGVRKGNAGCAVAVQVFPDDKSGIAFEKGMAAKGGIVRRSGRKVLAAVCPGDAASSRALFDAVLGQYAATGGGGVRGVSKANLESKLAALGWKRVGDPQEFNTQSLTLPIAKGAVGGAASFAWFDEPIAVKAFVETIAKQDGAAWLNEGGPATLVIVLPGQPQMARDLLASLTGAAPSVPATPSTPANSGVDDVALSGVAAFRIHQLTPGALRERLEGAGWNLLGQPVTEGASITISINRGVISGATSLKVFDNEPAADEFERQISAKPDAAVIRSGNKILAVVLPGNRGEAVRLLKALLQ